MIDWLLEIDRQLLIYLNGQNAPWLDPVMLVVTETFAWLPLYLFLIYLIVKDYRKEAWIAIIGVAVTILLSDQITSSIMKPYFARLRPSQEPTLVGIIHLVSGYKGGMYGFASSHAANTFGTATFFWLLFGDRRKWIGVLFLWAAIMTYSRIYLGVHYPGDILVGGMVGAISGVAGHRVCVWIKKLSDRRKEPSPTQ